MKPVAIIFALAACVSLIALMCLKEHRDGASELLLAVTGNRARAVQQAVEFGGLVHEQAADDESWLEKKIKELKARKESSKDKTAATGVSHKHVKDAKDIFLGTVANTKHATKTNDHFVAAPPVLARPILYSQETKDLYDKAQDYENQV